MLRGERASLAVARFREGKADLVTGGTVGDLPVALVADLRRAALRFDPAAGLFGLHVLSDEGPLGQAEVRRALSMAVDRGALVAALGAPELAPRETILPPGLEDVPTPALPAWSATPLPARRAAAAAAIAGAAGGEPLTLRVAVPDAPGYKLVFAHLRRDWRAIGVTAEAVPTGGKADLLLVDEVAAANVATWYLRRFECAASRVCSPEAEGMLEAARSAIDLAERHALLANADRALADLAPFIPLTGPVRWSLVSPRLTGFQPNSFAHHFLGSLLAVRR